MSSTRPSPSNSSSPPNNSNSPFLPTSFGSNSSAQTAMGTDVWRSPIERKQIEKNGALLSPAATTALDEKPTTIYIRKLPIATSDEALQSMLLFAKDLVNATFVQARYTEDQGYKTAIAHFKTLGGAQEARDRLNGKANANNDAKMLIELAESPGTIGPRRNTVDGMSRQGAGPMSNGQTRSRYNGTFEKMSPPTSTPGLGNGDFSVGEPLQGLFSPTSPVATAFPPARGKALINGDGEDDSDGLLQESMGIGTGHTVQPARRTTNPSIPISRFNSLSLNTTHGVNGLTSPPVSSFASPRSSVPGQSPAPSMNGMSPHPMSNMGHTNNYQPFGPQFARPANYPPVNPADQNPPCNTLYVGNLPIDTSEDELKAMFSKQRGYKRLCFRTKQNGPMCFVEFEDVSFATKALNELYGYPLHNSVKGGIRLSFSKNPLGVRTGQNNNIGPTTPLTPQATMPGMPNGMGLASFSTATGPPPGLAAPPGLHTAGGMNGNNTFGMFNNGGFGIGANEVSSPMRSQPLAGATSVAGNGFGSMGGGYQNYMMGR